MTEYIIETKDLEFVYPDGTYALRKLTISIQKGKKIAIVGANGAGKTTLFLNLNGVYKPTGGKVYFEGKEMIYNKKDILALKRNIGIVFQDANAQLFSASVFQEVSFGPMNLGLPKEEVRKRVEDALAKTGIAHLKKKPIHFLSGGQKKRVSIADILAMDPKVIFLDEPTAFVDPKTSSELMAFFDVLNKEGKTIVLSTHDMDKVYPWADYVFVMKEGAVIAEGIPQDIFRDDEVLKRADLEKPWMIAAYEEIIKRKPYLSKEEVPKTKEALFQLMTK
ncbi:energy-coupling factor ABC transporter ATP-binding protein [Thermotalea metallivorans]|uniref:ABC transporter ATP-binding protein n=1 Tax=Thermotalea metallivorans TaxID=520762 RepID=A0A140L4F5_9FIRM|nr:ATP-binding cassette domain-containing protein [Thermotalea metallivorans]KXG75430.1 Energy-coupling factor transporter ATP-binding protein EcfA3 [Thermotalea metallivorans]